MHLGPDRWQDERQVPPRSAQGLVPQPRGGDHKRRFRGRLPSEATAAVIHRPARFRLFAGVSVSRLGAGHAQPSGRHRPLQICRVQAERIHKGDEETDYWKQGRPYLNCIDYTIIKNVSTGALAFISGQFDMTSPYSLQVPVLRDVAAQTPQAICRLMPTNVDRNG